MLELKNITKQYVTAGETVDALKGIDLRFRESEFVSILGPSGCGKTTMLNIIGGLDKYTSGDLVINDISTKKYNDRDWDTYRNHSIGFVFQTYNLIPHQSVLQNVELALTLSGVGKAERRKRAKEALERVGLGDQLKKRPSEMSGGQMQRVAIARAIVNNPDIILADEPTGALDTETSVQVMEILKEIAKDRLVIMVTHNPELAEKYSTRIVKMLDGRVLSDSQPISDEEAVQQLEALKAKEDKVYKKKRPSMSFFTSFGLSLKNLFTKKGRTTLTAFAGSIGIIGIALIYAVSQGTTNYIDQVQEETLSSYPITIQAQHMDISTLLNAFAGKAESIEKHDNDAIYQKAMVYEMVNAFNSIEAQKNDLESFKKYLDDQRAIEDSKLSKAVSTVKYSYDLNLLIYTKNVDDEIIVSDNEKLTLKIMEKYMGVNMSSLVTMRDQYAGNSMASLMTSSSDLWRELLPGKDGKLVSDVIEKQYELVYGSWPSRYDEIVLFVDSHNELDDMTLYALGLKSEEEIGKAMEASLNKEQITYESHKWSYEEICAMDFRTVLSPDCYVYDEATETYTDLRETETGLKYLYDNGMKLHVVGIVRPDEDAVGAGIQGAIGYTSKLTEYLINAAHDSEVVKAQKADSTMDIFTGLPFKPSEKDMTNAQKAKEFKDYVESLDAIGKAAVYVKILSIPSEEEVNKVVEAQVGNMTREDMENAMLQAMAAQTGMGEAEMRSYIAQMSDEDIAGYFRKAVAEQYRAKYAEGVIEKTKAMTTDQLSMALKMALEGYTEEQCAGYYDSILDFSDSTYEDNLVKLGCLDIDIPSSISIYTTTFEAKDSVEEAIKEYNDSVDDLREIRYTDYVGLIMSSVTTIINAITYVLIAFVAVSLVVSSIMIGVITLISVQERTKEIGILRAIGASKSNVSSMFNAETMIIGFTSGLIGVIITYLLCIPINLILHKLTKINTLSAVLPLPVALILVAISTLLTLIAGIIPSRSAAKKDPVVALRTE